MTRPLHLLIGLALIAAANAGAATLRWSAAGELVTCDPHSVTDTAGVVLTGHIYEKLVAFDGDYKLAPALATSWERLTPTVTRFALRRGVTFHDGSRFTADDVVFSIDRIRHRNSLFKGVAAGFATSRRIDDYTVEVVTDNPLPTLLNQLAILPIMSKTWSQKNKVSEPADYAAGKEHYATRNASGTGPYQLAGFESGGKVVFTANPRWWGKRQGNVTDATYVPIKSNATRMAALLSGEIDVLTDPPVQDLERLKREASVKLLPIDEPRVLFLSFDLFHEELKYSNVKGKNPFRDRRVREAVRLAIDSQAIAQKVMRGHARAIGSMIAPGIIGYSARAAVPHTFDPVRARQLLSEAGYPNGFSVTLDCTNDRYMLDEQLCSAVAGMITRIGITTMPNPKPKAIFFQKTDVANRDSSMFIFGAFPTTLDTHTILESYFHTTGKGRGDFNTTGYSNPKMDGLIDAAMSELDAVKREQVIEAALLLNNEDVAYVPLHQTRPSWAMKKNIETPARLDANLDLRFVRVN